MLTPVRQTPQPVGRQMPASQTEHLSLTEYAVLGLLVEGPSHGFELSKLMAPDGPVGRIVSVRRPLTYRALERLVTLGLVARGPEQAGSGGPRRTLHRVTPRGRHRLRRWLEQPVEHIRDLRLAFQLKLTLLLRAGSSPLPLIQAQLGKLSPTVTAITEPSSSSPDHVELWRRHIALAAISYLQELEQVFAGRDS